MLQVKGHDSDVSKDTVHVARDTLREYNQSEFKNNMKINLGNKIGIESALGVA